MQEMLLPFSDGKMPNYLHYISLEIQQIKQERLLKDENNGNMWYRA